MILMGIFKQIFTQGGCQQQEWGITNKQKKSKIIFGGQMERSSILLCVAPLPTTAENNV